MSVQSARAGPVGVPFWAVRRTPLSDPRPRAVAVIVRDGKVLAMKRRLDGRAYAVLPGGGIEDGERAQDAALREFREECSFDGAVGDLLLEPIEVAPVEVTNRLDNDPIGDPFNCHDP